MARETAEDRIKKAYSRRSGSDPRYSWFTLAHLLQIQQRERTVLSLLKKHGATSLNQKRILDVGCGTGQWLCDFVRWGARPENLAGIDLLPNRVEEARKLCPPGVTLSCGNAGRLDFPDGHFDVVVQSTVFSSILEEDLRQEVAVQMRRVAAPSGLIIWYDFFIDNPKNSDVRGIPHQEISALFPGMRVDLRKLTLAPPLARALAPISSFACELLQRIPLLCTHYLAIIRE